MLVYACTCMFGVYACTENAFTLSKENGVFGVKTCSLILFCSTLKIKQAKMWLNTSKMMNQFTTSARFRNVSVYSIYAEHKVNR